MRTSPSPVARDALVAGLCLAVLAGCTRTETTTAIDHTYDPYAGDAAFPDRRPKFSLPNGDVGAVSNNGSDSVSVLDLAAGKSLGSAPVGRDPVAIDGPHHIAGDRAGGFVYVALAYPTPAAAPGPIAAKASSARPGFVQKLALADLAVLGEVQVDESPGDIVLSDDHQRLVVSHFDLAKALVPGGDLQSKRATLAVIDPSKLLPSASPDPLRIPTCVAPHGVALSRPDGKTAYVACYGEDSIAVVDLANPEAPIDRIPVGGGAGKPGAPVYGPYSAILSPSGARLSVGDIESKDVRFLDVGTKAIVPPSIKTMGAPYFPAWSADGTRLYIPTQSPDALIVADTTTGAVVTSREFDASCQRPHEARFSSDAAVLYVVCEGDHVLPSAVLALDPATLSTVATIPVGVYPDRVAVLGAP